MSDSLIEVKPDYILSPPKGTYDTEPQEEHEFKENQRIKRIKLGLCFDTEMKTEYWEDKPKPGQFYTLSSIELIDNWNSVMCSLEGEGQMVLKKKKDDKKPRSYKADKYD